MKSDFGVDIPSRPTVSLVLTIHNRTPEVSKAVADSFRLPGNEVDEVVIVLDRPTEEAQKGATEAWCEFASWSQYQSPVRFVDITGEPGWKCPAKAWNTAYKVATCDLLYQISSEVVQDAGNVDRARQLAANLDVAVFGACHNSEPTQLVVGAEPGLLASAAMPRPLGFIACMPRKNIEAIGGNDEAFMGGLWYEDDDLFFRLWQTGIDFLFTDAIHGVHLHHERPDLESAEGNAACLRNQALMVKKHGTPHPLQMIPKMIHAGRGQTRWLHPLA